MYPLLTLIILALSNIFGWLLYMPNEDEGSRKFLTLANAIGYFSDKKLINY